MIEASEVWATSLIDQISKVCHLVISLSTVSQIHAIRTFTSEAFRKLTKECPLSLYYPQYPVLKLDFIHMWCELRLWNCGALNKIKGFISKCTLVESKSGRERFNFLDDFPSKLKKYNVVCLQYLWLAKKTCALHEILNQLIITENAFSRVFSNNQPCQYFM